MNLTAIFSGWTFLLFSCGLISAGESVTVVSPTTEAGEDLDLQAVGELFKDSKNLEEFEKSLNDSAVGVNNLDLDSNGQVDFLRVVEEGEGDTRVVVLQAALAENEFQDVATLEVEKTEPEKYNMHVRGVEAVYGPAYYAAPVIVGIHAWPVITWMYRPGWRPYRSVYLHGAYPHWHRFHVRVAPAVYRTRVVHYSHRAHFVVTGRGRVVSAHRVVYSPRHSTLVRVHVRHHHGHGHVKKHRRDKAAEKRHR